MKKKEVLCKIPLSGQNMLHYPDTLSIYSYFPPEVMEKSNIKI